MINKESFEPIYLQIQRSIHDRVQSGVLKPGDQIPSEHEMVTEFGVSRATIRKSLERLVFNGVLIRQPGKGTFVSENLVHYGVSTMLSFSRTLTAQGYEVTTRLLRQEVIPGPEPVCAGLNLTPGSNVLLIQRLRNVNQNPVAIHISYFDDRLFSRLRNFDLERESLLESMEKIYGVHMATSRDSLRATIATPEECELFGAEAGLAVMEMEGISYDMRGKPTRFTRAIYRGDVFVLSVVNTHSQATSLAITDAIN